MNNQENKNSTLKVLYALISVVLVLAVAGTAVNVVVLKNSKAIAASVAKEDGETTEDYVTIADNYEIRPTTQISDAYKSGSTQGLDDKQKETLDMASSVLKKIIKDSMSDYEKEKAVYDWMTKNLSDDEGALSVIPTTTQDCDNPYGVLKFHNAVCVGYATTFRMFMQMLDIPCKVVHSSDKVHSWDLTELDGQWYHTDIYSDSGNNSYAHFNLNDEMMRNNQLWDQSFFPAATGVKYNIAFQKAEKTKSVNSIPKKLRKALDKKETLVSFLFDSQLKASDVKRAEYMLSNIQDILMSSDKYDSADFSWNWSSVDGSYLLAVTIDLSDSSEDSLSEKVQNELDKKVTDAFGDLGEASSDSLGENGSDSYYKEKYCGPNSQVLTSEARG